MRTFLLPTVCLLIPFFAACNKPARNEAECVAPPAERDIHTAEVKYFNDAAIENAIIAQHTLYPYHFVPNSTALNELGDHDFSILVEHFRRNPGVLNIRRGRGSSPALYDARVRLISDRLAQSGIEVEAIADGHPGGDGLTSEHALTILNESFEYDGQGQRSYQDSTARKEALSGGTAK